MAERYLEKHQPSDYRIVIEPEGISVDEQGWWEIPIHVTKENVPSYDWIGRSVEASVEMDEAEGVHVLFHVKGWRQLEGLPRDSAAFWIVRVLAIVLLFGALASVVVFCLGLMLTWYSERRKRQRGFEVKLTPGTMPGLLEKKEDHHG